MTTKKIKAHKNSTGIISKTSIKFLKNKFLLIFVVVLLAYFQTLFMYFWNDDNAVIFKLQHLSEGMGNLGSGIFGFDSPYRMVIFSLIPIYYLFGINPLAFFAYGLFFYFLAAITVYFFAKSFFKEGKLAILTSLIFASGLVGAESLWRVYNSVHTSITIIYILLFVIFYNIFISRRNLMGRIIFYSLSLGFFYLAIQWGFVRAHGIIFIILAQEVLFNFDWRFSFLRLAPFFYLSYISYFAPSINTKHVQLLFTRLFENYELELLLVPIGTLKNAIMPDIFNIPLILFAVFLFLLLIQFKSKIFFFALTFITSSYLIYYVIYHDLILNTTHRYLTTALPGVSLLITYIFSKIFRNNVKLAIASGILIIINICLINWIQFDILKDRSIPTRDFYDSLKREVPILNKNSILYFNVKQDSDSINLFETFFGVGSMPNSTAIAIHYSLDRYDLFLSQTFEETASLMKEKNVAKENVYTFFYSKKNGLKNTTKKFRESLWGEKRKYFIEDLDRINHQFASPLKVNLKLKPSVKQLDKKENKDTKDLEVYLNYLQSKHNYYNLVTVKSDTYWQNYTIDKIFDQDYSTSWMGSRGVWNDTKKETITLDLTEQRYIGAIKLKFGASDKTATKYIYHCSKDNLNWQKWKTVYFKPKEHAETKIDLVEVNLCRFIKITIEETDKGDSPEIAEIEIIEKGYENLNFNLALQYEESLVSLLNSDKKALISDYLSRNGLKINICFITDEYDIFSEKAKSKLCQKKFARLNEFNKFEIILPQSGTIFKKLFIPPQPNVEFEINQGSLSNILFNEL